MAYVTLADLKVFLGIADTADDVTLQRSLDASEEQVNAFTGRRFSADESAVVRYYDALDRAVVAIDPLSTTTDLVVQVDQDGDGTFEDTLTINTDFRLDPYNAVALGWPYTSLAALTGTTFPKGSRRIKVTGRWGWPAVPASIKQATLIQASRLWKRKESPFGVAGSPEFGNELRLLAALDPDVQALLRPYKHQWAVVV